MDMSQIGQMIEPAMVALHAYLLAEAGREAAKEVGKEVGKGVVAAGKRVFGWLKDKLTGPAAGALEQVREKPDSASRGEALVAQLKVLAEENEAFAAELVALLEELRPELPKGGISQVMTFSGDVRNVKAAQITGDKNQVSQ